MKRGRKKYYAVKKGRKTGIFTSWDECKEQVNGFSGSLFQSFTSEAEAEAFLAETELPPKKKQRKAEPPPHGTDIWAYVDGSFDSSTGVITGGGGVLHVKGKMCPFAVKTKQPELTEMRNVGGEILSAIAAVEKVKELGMKEITIYHDYEGISAWTTSAWKTNKAATKAYAKYMKGCGIKVSFQKVQAHVGIEYNELADRIAKFSIGFLPADQYLHEIQEKVGDVAVDTVTLDLSDGMIKKEIEKEEEEPHGDEGDDE